MHMARLMCPDLLFLGGTLRLSQYTFMIFAMKARMDLLCLLPACESKDRHVLSLGAIFAVCMEVIALRTVVLCHAEVYKEKVLNSRYPI